MREYEKVNMFRGGRGGAGVWWAQHLPSSGLRNQRTSLIIKTAVQVGPSVKLGTTQKAKGEIYQSKGTGQRLFGS